MENITIAGRLGSDAKLSSTQGGHQVCNFNVAVDTFANGEKGTNWWRCALWGKRAEKVSPYLLKGVSVTVAGGFELGEYEGKPQLNIRASEVTLQGSRGDSRGERKQPYEQSYNKTSQPRPDADNHMPQDALDDEIPF